MYIFVFKYLNTSFAAIPRERVRKIFRRLFTEPLLPLREAQDSFFDFLRFHSSLWNVKAGSVFFFFFFLSLFFFFCFFFLFSSPFSFLFHREDFIEPRYFLELFPIVIPGSSCRTIKRWTERNGETPFSVRKEKRRGEEGKERKGKKVRESEKFASSSDNTRFRQPTVDYFYARTQLFIVQRIIRSIRPLRHSHYENSRSCPRTFALFFRQAIFALTLLTTSTTKRFFFFFLSLMRDTFTYRILGKLQ